MTVLKTKLEKRTILDFSRGKVSKNLIRQRLRTTDISAMQRTELSDCVVLISNTIKIGMYHVQLCLMGDPHRCGSSKLKDFGGFQIIIQESGKDHYINLARDTRFKNQYWVGINDQSKLKINNLVDAIMYCYKLNNLKAFL